MIKCEDFRAIAFLAMHLYANRYSLATIRDVPDAAARFFEQVCVANANRVHEPEFKLLFGTAVRHAHEDFEVSDADTWVSGPQSRFGQLMSPSALGYIEAVYDSTSAKAPYSDYELVECVAKEFVDMMTESPVLSADDLIETLQWLPRDWVRDAA